MTSLPRSTEDRLRRLVDRRAYLTDAQYHATVGTFRHWLETTKMALEDEGADTHFIECVLNRIVYGHPSGAEAYERIDMLERHKEMMEKMPAGTRTVQQFLAENGMVTRIHKPNCASRNGNTPCNCAQLEGEH